MAEFSHKLPASIGGQLCSGCGRWAQAGVLTLPGIKQSLGPATGTGSNGSCTRHFGRSMFKAVRTPPATASLPIELAVPTRCCLSPRSRMCGAQVQRTTTFHALA
jgi:hypothetical protein